MSKVFYINNDTDIVSSGGVLLYRFINGEMELLLSDTRGLYEDLGGKVDDNDKNINSSISREVHEESNGLIDKKSIKARLLKNNPIYIKKSKYLLYILHATPKERTLKSEDFGNKEIHDDINRTIKWIPLDIFLSQKIIKHRLNWRLKNKKIFDALKEIKIKSQLSKNVFIKKIE